MAKQLPDLKFSQLFNISFGFFGVQIAYALQSANISRIFATLGADPHSLSFFWLLPPIMGMIVQPLVGKYSDRTWTRWGRRIPYLFVGALVAILVMCFLPNAGSLGMSVNVAMIFGAVMLMLLDTSINMAMQPFKMMVGDMVNEKQKTTAYSIQSFLCNAGSLVGYLFPWLFATFGLSGTAPQGEVPDTVKFAFYIGAAILIICVVYTSLLVKEYAPAEYNEYHPVDSAEAAESEPGMLELLRKAPSAFWSVGLVQFFSWAAFMYMWTYTAGAIATVAFDAPTVLKDGKCVLDTTSAQYNAAGDWVGVLFAVQAIGSMLWAVVLPRFRNIKMAYTVSLVMGGIGFISTSMLTSQYARFISFALIGAGWAAMLALPFTILTNALKGGHVGTYLGLFNCTICLPQIIAAALGGLVLGAFTTPGQLAPEVDMLVLAGVLLLVGGAAVWIIKEHE